MPYLALVLQSSKNWNQKWDKCHNGIEIVILRGATFQENGEMALAVAGLFYFYVAKSIPFLF